MKPNPHCEICEGTGVIINEGYEDIHFPNVTCECAKKEKTRKGPPPNTSS